MKKIVFFIFLLVIVFFAVIKFNNNVKEGSVTLQVQEGIKLAKKDSHLEANKVFMDALFMLDKKGFKLHSQDLKEFASLLNEFKTKGVKYVKMFQLLDVDLQNIINNLQSSKDITSNILDRFCENLNKLLMREDFYSAVFIEDKEKQMEFKNKILAKNRFHQSLKDNISLNQYVNRLYLSYFFKKFFLKPISRNEIILNQALSLFAMSDYIQCNKILEEVIGDNNFYIKAYILLSRSYEKTKGVEDSIKILENGLEKVPSNEKLLTEIAYYYNKSGRNLEATAILEQALQVNPSYKYALAMRNNMERDKVKALKGVLFYQDKLDKGDQSIFNLSNLSLALRKVNKVEECSIVISKAQELFPADSFFIKMQGWIEASKKNYKNAVSALLKAKKIVSQPDPEIFLFLGITYFNQNLEEEAYLTLKQGVSLFPEDKSILFNLARICEMSAIHNKEAIIFYQDFLLKFKDNKLSSKIQKKIENLREKS